MKWRCFKTTVGAESSYVNTGFVPERNWAQSYIYVSERYIKASIYKNNSRTLPEPSKPQLIKNDKNAMKEKPGE
jgi:hypothetical protein